jgi:2,4-dienoyl-CoA reductase (NADPH2)
MPENTIYPNLLSPLKVGSVTLRNRVVMGSMHTGLEDRVQDSGKLAAYLAERAAGGVALLVTGGFAPNRAGWLVPFGGKLTRKREMPRHRRVTRAVQAEGARICLQILHAGRYGYHPWAVAPSAIKAPISRFKPRALSSRAVDKQIVAFVRCAVLARNAGYDGVEIMGSEGYLINQFIVRRTNRRTDCWGGAYQDRIAFPLEIVRRVREACGPDFLIIFRLSMLDLVEEGSTWDEVKILAKGLESAGASILNTGIGWHEARIPTIAQAVPRGAFAWVTERLRNEVSLPLITSNRINTPEQAEDVLTRGQADLVSLARPLLADPHLVSKAAQGRSDEINTCIACNQACLDNIFSRKRATCLVNPRACYETELSYGGAKKRRRFAVVGAGPAGLSCAAILAQRGHQVRLLERGREIGGQLLLARRVPGKDEFNETLRYFGRQLELHGVELALGQEAQPGDLAGQGFDAVVLATGVSPRMPEIQGLSHPSVLTYADLLQGPDLDARKVAIVGAGGIGFDVAELLTEDPSRLPASLDPERFLEEWGIDPTLSSRGGLVSPAPSALPAFRKVYLLQRKPGKPGKDLGKTTGWIHRLRLKRKGVQMLGGVTYGAIDDSGLHIQVGGEDKLLEVDRVVICAGQTPRRDLEPQLRELGVKVHIIGGARDAAGLDAQRAINEGCRLAARL